MDTPSTLLLENGDTFIEESLNAYTGLFMNPAVALDRRIHI
jgi:hypothetical protein